MAITFTKLDRSTLPGHAEIPYCMTITSPVRKAELAKECEGKVVRCVLETGAREFTASELVSIAKFLERDSSIVLAVGSPRDTTQFDDLTFLQHFPNHRAFYFGLPHLNSIEPLVGMSAQLVSLSIHASRAKNFNWELLERCERLRYLAIVDLPRVLAYLPSLRKLEHLALDHTSAATSTIELPKSLVSFQATLGSLPDLRFLARARKLKLLELWKCKLPGSLTVIEGLKNLNHLGLRNLKDVTLPSFQSLKKLKSLHLQGLKHVGDLTSLRKLKELEKLAIVDLPILTMDGLGDMDFYCQLEEFRVGLGSGRLAKSITNNILSKCPNAKHEYGNRSLIGNSNTLSYVTL